MTPAPAPGVEALPSNWQSNELPLFIRRHVSVPDGPVTVNRATGTVAPTVSVAVRVALRLPLIVTVVGVETAVVDTVNVPLVEPAAIVMLDGTVATAVLSLDSVTTAPPEGAALSSVAVPVDGDPPATLVGFKLSEVSDSAGTTVVTCNVVEAVTPLYDALIVTVKPPPTARVATLNVALVAP